MAHIGAYVLNFITFGVLPMEICFIITNSIAIIAILCMLIQILGNILSFILSLFGIQWEFDLIESHSYYKHQRKKKKSLNERLAKQETIIKPELEKVIKEYGLVADNTLIESINLPNNITYMNNDEKYLFVMEQEKKVKSLLNQNKHFFGIRNNDIYINEHYHQNDHHLSYLKSGYGFEDKDIEFLSSMYPIQPQYIERIVEKRNQAFNVIRESLSKATMEAILTKKGYDGERYVANTLSLYKDNYIILNNIRVELEGKSSESDFVIICDKGIFVIEVKNHGNANSSIEISSDGRWVMNKNGRKEVKDNVSAQNNRHCAINQSLINKALKENGYDGEYIKCKSIIVIANDNVEIKNHSMNTVLRTSEIITYIENLNSEYELPKDLQEEIKGILLTNNLPAKKYPVNDIYGNFEYALNEFIKTTQALRGYKKLIEVYRSFIK